MRDDERIAGRDELDKRIDAALQSYVNLPEATEPRIALALVMERARAEPSRRRGWWILAAAVSAAVVIIAAAVWMGWMGLSRRPEIARVPQAPAGMAVPAQPAHVAAGKTSVSDTHRTTLCGHSPAHRELAASRARLPRLAIFPTPRPLTPEEQALAAFAKHGPPAVRRAVIEDQKHWDDPIIVAGLHEQPPQAGSQQDQ
ncbi:MAG TPA: hypothetical protein VHU89_17275 [Acidobacteriaceae bacterium]|jgi:hypothetical protein|nr:hypothetical protein [Acidobacteriaceae bacterium]